MGSLFGGSKQSSTQSSQSGNKAYDYLSGAFSPVVSQGVGAGNAVNALLGGDASGFNAFKNATGFDAASQLGSQGITGNAAASGLLRSGGTAKALQNYGDTIQNQYANNYLSQLMGLAGLGTQAGGIISDAGRYSNAQGTSSGSSKNGLGGLLGGIGSRIAMSDPRLKTDVIYLGKNKDDIPIYEFSYVFDKRHERHVGTMANEVRNEYLGPKVLGYDTVNYDMVDTEVTNG